MTNNILTRNFWTFERITTIVIILIGIVTLIYTAHPAILFPEKVDYNPEIRLARTLITQQDLIFLEKGIKSINDDKIESYKVTDLNSNEKQVSLNFVETDDMERFIFVALADPNNMVRFVSNSVYGENLDIFFNSTLRPISVQRQVRIRIPASNDLNIEGVWHLNIYLYNSQKELSLVISKPMDFSNVSREVSNMDIVYSAIISFIIGIIIYTVSHIKRFSIKDVTPTIIVDNPQSELITINTGKNHIGQTKNRLKNDGTYEVEGVIVDVPQYGLIKRCRECRQILEKGMCQKHGKVGAQGIYDLYLEPILFDGFTAHVLLIERPIIEELFNMKLNQCRTIAEENLDSSIIKDMIKKQIVGRFYHVEGIYSANGIKVIYMERKDQIPKEDLMALFDRWKMSEIHFI